MKLWHSFSKELTLSSKSWYFYIELGMAFVLLALLIFVVPDEFDKKGKTYYYLDLPELVKERFEKNLLEDDIDERIKIEEIDADGQLIELELYETDEAKIYLVDSKDKLDAISKSEGIPVVHVRVNENQQIIQSYYLQGYETDKLKNLLKVSSNQLAGHDVIKDFSDNMQVKKLYQNTEPLSDKENIIPVFLTFNGSLMSIFIIAAYVFLDKGEGIIKAYAITASSVWHYLLSKIGVIIVTSIITSLIITVPIMGLQANYLLLLMFLVTTGFFAASLGLLISSFFNDIIEAFGVMYLVIMIMILPNIAYFAPTWDPNWVKMIPSYVMLQGYKEIISVGGNIIYVLLASLAFTMFGMGIFILATHRFKKTLSL